MVDIVHAQTGREVPYQTMYSLLTKLANAGQIEFAATNSLARRDSLMNQLRRNAAHKMAKGQSGTVTAKRLRLVDMVESGLPCHSPRDHVADARRWAERQRAAREVIDVDTFGELYSRPAMPHELGQDGSLVSLVVQAPPGVGLAAASG